MDQELKRILSLPGDKLGQGTSIGVRFVDDDKDMFYDIAIEILAEVEEHNRQGKKTVFIWPVGPIGQYQIMAKLANRFRISFKNVHVFQMDEYLDDNMQPISPEDPLSFTGFIRKNFWEKLDPELAMPIEQIYVPRVDDNGFNWNKIQELGGIDTAYGGVGINGHIAFNEPLEPEDDITDEEFKNLPTRVLKITRETRTINSYTATKGTLDLMPHYCVTIGMKEILSARKIRFYCNREWQTGIVRKLLHGPVTRFVPASFFQQHPDARLTITKAPYQLPMGELR